MCTATSFPTTLLPASRGAGSLARAATFVDSVREAAGDGNVVLLDNGDILQGQPTVYYYNFIDTVAPHIASRIYDFMRYDAATIGNHDVETGHPVYDRWMADTKVPVLGANVIDTATCEPYLKPYQIIEKDGIRIAVIGRFLPPQYLHGFLKISGVVYVLTTWRRLHGNGLT